MAKRKKLLGLGVFGNIVMTVITGGVWLIALFIAFLVRNA